MAGRYLSADELVQRMKDMDRQLPQRGGAKDYAPDGSWLQDKHLESLHRERQQILEEERVKKCGTLSTGVWREDTQEVQLLTYSGKFWETLGYEEQAVKYLQPEEAMYLIDEGFLEVDYKGMPLSVQDAFRVLLGDNIPIENYQVYAHLSRLGYIVQRHTGVSDVTPYERKIRLDQHIHVKKRKRKFDNGQSNLLHGKQTKLGSTKSDTDTTAGISEKDSSSKMDLHEMSNKDLNSMESCDQGASNQELVGESANEKHQADHVASGPSNKKSDVTHEPANRTTVMDHVGNVPSGSSETGKSSVLGSLQKSVGLIFGSACQRKTPTGISSRTSTSLVTSMGCQTDSLEDTLYTPHLSAPYSDWNFEEIKFPSLADGMKTLQIGFPQKNLIPESIAFKEMSYKFDIPIGDSVTRKDALLNKKSLNFSHGSVGWKSRSKARNWAEYKKEMAARTEDDVLLTSPVGHYWEGDVTPLVKPQDSISVDAVLDKLRVIKNVNLSQQQLVVQSPPAHHIAFDIFLPRAQFRKSNPGLPDHRVVIVSQESDPPDLATMMAVAHRSSDGVPLHWAVVDNGTVAFFSFNDVDLPSAIKR